MNRHDSVHPEAGEILRYADGELSTKEAAEMRAHLEACWQCRAAHSDVQKSIGEYVRYREVSAGLLPAPPRPWFDIYRQFDLAGAALAQPSAAARLFGSIRAFFTSPARLAPVALALVAGFVVTDTFRNTPSVKAAELLRRASAVEPKIAKPRHVKIRTAKREFTRLVAPRAVPAVAFSGDGEMRALFVQANYSWDEPLSARSYQNWHDSLASKSDSVAEFGSGFEIRTTADTGAVSQASIQLAADLHALGTQIQLRDGEKIEISEVQEPTAAIAAVPAPVSPTAPALPNPTPTAAVPAGPTAVDELEAVARLHRIGADLGEPVEVVRDGQTVTVRGIGIEAARQAELRAALDGVPFVSFQFPETGVLSVGTPNQRGASVRGQSSPLQQKLEQQLGGHPAFEAFSSRVLDSSDQMMARVHALRRLAAQFPPAVETALGAAGIQTLSQIRAGHAQAMARHAAAVARAMQPELVALGASPVTLNVTPPANWQAGAEVLFETARGTERMLGSLLGGAGAASADLPADLLTNLTQLQGLVQAYH